MAVVYQSCMSVSCGIVYDAHCLAQIQVPTEFDQVLVLMGLVLCVFDTKLK